MQKETGFTIVEITIVMIVIGLVVAGILKMNDVAEESRVKASVTEATAYSTAVQAFQDKYYALPGDIPNAMNVLNGCDAAANCVNGDGNKYIGRNDLPPPSWNHDQIGTAAVEVETTQFWKHLAMADLISGVDVNANPDTPLWNVTHPAARMKKSGWTVGWYTDLGGADDHYLRLQRYLKTDADVASKGIEGSGTYSVTVEQAFDIELEFDDGNGASGKIQVQGSACPVPPPESYDQLAKKNCYVFFRL